MFNECRHIFTSGRKCHSPALKDQSFCYFHSNTRNRTTPANAPYKHIAPIDHVLDLTPLEDADAIQLAISEVVLALAANTIDTKRARALFYGLQIASQNWRARAALAAKEAETAESQKQALTVCETHRHEDGSLIGPEAQSLDPEEERERKRPPSLGQILLAEVEVMKKEKAEKEARRKAGEIVEEDEDDQPATLNLPKIYACADTSPRPCRTLRSHSGREGAISSMQAFESKKPVASMATADYPPASGGLRDETQLCHQVCRRYGSRGEVLSRYGRPSSEVRVARLE